MRDRDPLNPRKTRAGDGGRTRDVQLGELPGFTAVTSLICKTRQRMKNKALRILWECGSIRKEGVRQCSGCTLRENHLSTPHNPIMFTRATAHPDQHAVYPSIPFEYANVPVMNGASHGSRTGRGHCHRNQHKQAREANRSLRFHLLRLRSGIYRQSGTAKE